MLWSSLINNRNLLLIAVAAEKSKFKVSVDSVCSEIHLLWFIDSPLHVAEVGRELPAVSFTRALMPFPRALPSSHNYLSEAPLLNTIMLGLKF